MTKWEYQIAPLDPATFKALGLEGWELVAIYNGQAWFKRPIDGRRKP